MLPRNTLIAVAVVAVGLFAFSVAPSAQAADAPTGAADAAALDQLLPQALTYKLGDSRKPL